MAKCRCLVPSHRVKLVTTDSWAFRELTGEWTARRKPSPWKKINWKLWSLHPRFISKCLVYWEIPWTIFCCTSGKCWCHFPELWTGQHPVIIALLNFDTARRLKPPKTLWCGWIRPSRALPFSFKMSICTCSLAVCRHLQEKQFVAVKCLREGNCRKQLKSNFLSDEFDAMSLVMILPAGHLHCCFT